MLRRGRPPNNRFDPAELLFHRFNRDMISPAAHPDGLVLQIRVPDASVNRSEPDGKPEDVLLGRYPKYKNWGILAFQVADVPTPYVHDAGGIHHRVEHDPLEKNYYHSEVGAYNDATFKTRRGHVTNAMKTWFRLELSKRLVRSKNIIKHPEE